MEFRCRVWQSYDRPSKTWFIPTRLHRERAGWRGLFSNWTRGSVGVWASSNIPRIQIAYFASSCVGSIIRSRFPTGPSFCQAKRSFSFISGTSAYRAMTGQGNFQWARQFSRLLGHSLRELVVPVETISKLCEACARTWPSERASIWIRSSDSVIISASGRCETPCRSQPARFLHRFGENILIGLLILAHNRRAFRLDCLRRSRADVFLPRAKLDERFGTGSTDTMTGEVMAAAFLGLSMVGCLYVLGAAVMTLCFERRDPPLPSQVDPVTISSPYARDEPHLYERLRSFCTQDFPAPVQVVLGVQDLEDPALGPQLAGRHSRIG